MIPLINHDFQGSVAVRSLEFTQILWNINIFETTNQKTWPFFIMSVPWMPWSRYIGIPWISGLCRNGGTLIAGWLISGQILLKMDEFGVPTILGKAHIRNITEPTGWICCGTPTFPCHPTRLTCTNSQLVSIWNPENSADWSVKK